VIEQLVSDPGLGDPAPGSEPRHMSARLVGGPDAVLVTYDLGGAERASLRSSIWVRDAQTWRLLFHQGTPAASR
ncbi:MAG: hypothetical protein ACE5GB_07545, partial [Acidimicrobiales bacterium]